MLIESVTPRNASGPLLAVTKAEAVYVETRSRILKGTLAPGSAVNQEALAAELECRSHRFAKRCDAWKWRD